MPTLIFIHSPVASPATWEAVADLAERADYATRIVSLTDAIFHPVSGGPPYLEHCAEAIATAARGCARPILVAHSGAGLLLAAAATEMDAPAGAVVVDGLMPQPGKSWFDTAPPALSQRIRALAQDGVVAPWQEWWPPGAIRAFFKREADYQRLAAATPRVPLAFFEEPAPPMDMPAEVPCAYLRLSAACDADADEAQRRGWSVVRREANHIAMLTDAALVWSDLRTIANAMMPPLDA